jgi:3-methyladenine DNA glycosylase AlkC
LLAAGCVTPQQMLSCAEILFENLASDDLLTGVPIFLMAEYGKTDFAGVLDFFTRAADAKDWVVREFSAAAFRRLVTPCRQVALPWLRQTALSASPNLRRFVSETLRPVTEIQWLQREPETSLDILCLLFREAHPYPRTSVGNNLSDLARRNPELILEIVQELVASGDKNSQWIAYRACRNLIKKDPLRVMNLLGVKEYHYKDRIYTLEALQ